MVRAYSTTHHEPDRKHRYSAMIILSNLAQRNFVIFRNAAIGAGCQKCRFVNTQKPNAVIIVPAQCWLKNRTWFLQHYCNVIMSAMASQITGVLIVCSTVCLGADQRKHQSSASLAFVRGIHRWPVDFPHKGPVTRKMRCPPPDLPWILSVT